MGKIEKSNLLASRSSANILAIRTPLSLHCSQPNLMLISLLNPMRDSPSLQPLHSGSTQILKKSFQAEWKKMERKPLKIIVILTGRAEKGSNS